MRDDYFTNTEADAGRFAAHFGEVYDDDRPSLSDLADRECPACGGSGCATSMDGRYLGVCMDCDGNGGPVTRDLA